MSEYQYYEFLAIDRPLSSEEMKELRSISSRAEITPTSFCNVYNYGDLNASTEKLMEKYFDAHVYVSNWGTYEFQLRFPLGVIAQETLHEYAVVGALDYHITDSHIVVFWQRDDDEGGEWVDGDGWMGLLAPIREEIECGDYRALYIGWLAGEQYWLTEDAGENGDHDTDTEPPVPPGMKALTNAQEVLAELLDVDEDLLAAASLGSPPISPEDSHRQMEKWVATVPEREGRNYLLAVLRRESRSAERRIRGLYSEFRRLHGAGSGLDAQGRRTIAEIRALVRVTRQKRNQREELKRERERIERERKRREYLKELAGGFPHWWKQADDCAEEGKSSAYDKARDILVDLRDAHAQEGRQDEFEAGILNFASRYSRKPALIRRLKEAGIMVS